MILISTISDNFVLRLYLRIRLDKIFCLVFCSGYHTLVLIDLLLKVSEHFRGCDNLDNSVIAADDDKWGQLD